MLKEQVVSICNFYRYSVTMQFRNDDQNSDFMIYMDYGISKIRRSTERVKFYNLALCCWSISIIIYIEIIFQKTITFVSESRSQLVRIPHRLQLHLVSAVYVNTFPYLSVALHNKFLTLAFSPNMVIS